MENLRRGPGKEETEIEEQLAEGDQDAERADDVERAARCLTVVGRNGHGSDLRHLAGRSLVVG